MFFDGGAGDFSALISRNPRLLQPDNAAREERRVRGSRSFRLVLIGQPGDRPWFNIALVFVPIAFASSGWPDVARFFLAVAAMVPLAERLGFATESVADHSSDTFGGLLNATCGNLPELVIAIFAIRDGLLRVVQLSLLGSILSNLLLVLGARWGMNGRPSCLVKF